MTDIDKVIELLYKKTIEAALAYSDLEFEKSGYFERGLKRKYSQGVFDGIASEWCAAIELKQELEAGK